MLTAVVNEKLQAKFVDWLKTNKTIVKNVSKACKREISVTTFANWRSDGYVTRKTVERFLEAYPELDKDEWLSLFDENEDKAA